MQDRSKKSDSRRRIVLKMRGVRPNRAVLLSAVRIAASFRGQLRGYFAEDEELLALAGLPFAREVSSTGFDLRNLTPDIIRTEMAAAIEAIRRDFEQLAEGGEFEAILETNAPDPREFRGIIAYGEPIERAATRLAQSILNEITTQRAATGILVGGNRARRSTGPVVALLEPGCDVRSVVDTAEHIARFDRQKVVLIVEGQTAEEMEELSNAGDQALDPDTIVSRFKVGMIEPRSLAFMVNSLGAGLAVAWAGGAVGGESIRHFAHELECPLLLMQ